MSRGRRRRPWTVLGVALGTLLAASASLASTECDSDPDAVPFEPSVNPALLNALLSSLGQQDVSLAGTVPLTLPGFCVTHHLQLAADLFAVTLDGAPFTVTPSPGAIQVDLTMPGPFQFGLDGSGYSATGCDPDCVVDLPYVGEVFNGCDVEAGIVGPVLNAFAASVTFDDATVTQIADTCVLGDCTAVNPLKSSTASLSNFAVNVTGGGSCQVCLDFPDPLPDPPCFDPCSGLGSTVGSLLEPLAAGALAQLFVTAQGDGVLIQVFHHQIVTDFGCIPIAEVRECRQQQPPAAVAGLASRSRGHGWNSLLYLLPLAFAAGLVIRLRRARR